jgi:hypothetical protein
MALKTFDKLEGSAILSFEDIEDYRRHSQNMHI